MVGNEHAVRQLRRARASVFAADPIGRYVIGPGYLLWCATPHLGGSALWSGPLREEQVRETMRMFDHRHAVMIPPFDLVTDGRLVTEFEPTIYRLMADYYATRWAELSNRIRRHAVIVPTGLVGTIMVGTYLRDDPEHKVHIFDRAQPAFEWIEAVRLVTQLDTIITDATAVTPLVRELRSYLEQQLRNASVETAARTIGVSTRSLQRQLGQAGTSFRDELDQVRVRAAKILLRGTREKLDSIAVRVGCASGSHLNALFRRVTGQPPGRHRA